MALFYSFLWLSSIPLCVCVCVCVCVCYIFQGVHLKHVWFILCQLQLNIPTPVLLPRESHGQWSLVGYNSPWGHKESDPTGRLRSAQQMAAERSGWRKVSQFIRVKCLQLKPCREEYPEDERQFACRFLRGSRNPESKVEKGGGPESIHRLPGSLGPYPTPSTVVPAPTRLKSGHNDPRWGPLGSPDSGILIEEAMRMIF